MGAPPPRLGAPGDPCGSCGSALAEDQRHCLSCGTRRGPARVDYAAILGLGAVASQNRTSFDIDHPLVTPARRAVASGPRWAPAVPLVAAVALGILVGSAGPRAGSSFAGGGGGELTVNLPPQVAAVPPTPLVPPTPAIPDIPDVPAATPVPAAIPAEAPAEPFVEPAPVDAPDETTATPEDDAGQDDAGQDVADEAPKDPAIDRVALIVLRDGRVDQLPQDVRDQGTVLNQHHALTRGGLANRLAIVSGQGPTPEQLADCPEPSDMPVTEPDADGQAPGPGCIHPATTGTLVDQLAGVEKRTRSYIDAAPACTPTSRNPLDFFHSITDVPDRCDRLGDLPALDRDLAGKVAERPALQLLLPDGTDPAAQEAFVRAVLPRLMRGRRTLVIVTFDQAPADDTATCCFVPAYLNAPGAPGGGRVGALLLHPELPAGTVDETPTNHLDLLRSLSTAFAVEPLGYASRKEVTGLPLATLRQAKRDAPKQEAPAQTRSTSSVDQPKPRAASPSPVRGS